MNRRIFSSDSLELQRKQRPFTHITLEKGRLSLSVGSPSDGTYIHVKLTREETKYIERLVIDNA